MEKYVTIGTQRTGSSLLVSLLNNDPRILSVGEAFHPKAKDRVLNSEYSYQSFLRKNVKRNIIGMILKEKYLSFYLDSLYNLPDKMAIGFKLLMWQAKKFPSINDYLVENKIKVIRTKRDNYLKKYVSLRIARKRQLYGATKKLENMMIDINPEKIFSELVTIEREEKEVENYIINMEKIIVTYENLLDSFDQQCDKIKKFLNINQNVRLKSPLVKMNSNNLRDLIRNYDEIASELKGSKYEEFLY